MFWWNFRWTLTSLNRWLLGEDFFYSLNCRIGELDFRWATLGRWKNFRWTDQTPSTSYFQKYQRIKSCWTNFKYISEKVIIIIPNFNCCIRRENTSGADSGEDWNFRPGPWPCQQLITLLTGTYWQTAMVSWRNTSSHNEISE